MGPTAPIRFPKWKSDHCMIVRRWLLLFDVNNLKVSRAFGNSDRTRANAWRVFAFGTLARSVVPCFAFVTSLP